MKYTILAILLIPMLLFPQTTQWRLVWDANPPSDNVDFYEVNRTDGFQINVSETFYVDDNIEAGVLYIYWLRAHNAVDYSNPSQSVSESIPKALEFEDQTISYDGTFDNYNLSNYVNEPDGDQVTWNFVSTNPNLTVNASGNVILNNDFTGTVVITATVKDDIGFNSFTNFYLTRNQMPIPAEVDSIWFELVD